MRAVLSVLYRWAGKGGVVHRSKEQIAHDAGIKDKRTVNKVLRDLAARTVHVAGHDWPMLTMSSRKAHGKDLCTRYTLPPLERRSEANIIHEKAPDIGGHAMHPSDDRGASDAPLRGAPHAPLRGAPHAPSGQQGQQGQQQEAAAEKFDKAKPKISDPIDLLVTVGFSHDQALRMVNRPLHGMPQKEWEEFIRFQVEENLPAEQERLAKRGESVANEGGWVRKALERKQRKKSNYTVKKKNPEEGMTASDLRLLQEVEDKGLATRTFMYDFVGPNANYEISGPIEILLGQNGNMTRDEFKRAIQDMVWELGDV